jgi:phenylacetate-coenzyme A ligase PaaK-like adenylate-forming protein
MKEQYKLVWLFYKIKYSEYLSKDKLENQKLLKLKRILKIAVETVPYYLNLKEKIDFDNFTIAELQKFPIINKNIMRSNPELFKSTK